MPSIISIQKLYDREPLRKNRWYIEFADIPRHPNYHSEEDLLTSEKISEEDLRAEKTVGDALSLSLASATRPNIGLQEVEFIRGHNKFFYPAGRIEYEPLEISFNDLISVNSASRIMYNWFSNVYNSNTSDIGYKNNFKAEAYLYMLDPKGNIIEKWTFHDIWPRNINFNDLAYDSTESVKVTVTFRYDQFQYAYDSIIGQLMKLSPELGLASSAFGIPDEFGFAEGNLGQIDYKSGIKFENKDISDLWENLKDKVDRFTL